MGMLAGGDRGQSMVEYALVLVFVAIALIVLVGALGQTIVGFYHQVNNAF